MPTPVLETERLILRVPEEADLDAWAAFMADPDATRFLGGVQGRAGAWRGLATMVGSWALRGSGFLSVIEKASGQWVGRVGPWHPEEWPGTEVGWGIASAHQRRGYAVEAAAASIDWAFAHLGWTEVIHCIDADNVASRKVAEKLGSRLLRHWPSLQPFDQPVDIWGQSRDEWAVNRQALRTR